MLKIFFLIYLLAESIISKQFPKKLNKLCIRNNKSILSVYLITNRFSHIDTSNRKIGILKDNSNLNTNIFRILQYIGGDDFIENKINLLEILRDEVCISSVDLENKKEHLIEKLNKLKNKLLDS
jgi:hypothetical protein